MTEDRAEGKNHPKYGERRCANTVTQAGTGKDLVHRSIKPIGVDPQHTLTIPWVYYHNHAMKIASPAFRSCLFLGSSQRDLASFPEEVRGEIGHALHEAQCGTEPYSAKALKGFGGRGVLELIENYDGDTYRAVYTVRYAGSVYVLHCFQKKSKKGSATPQHDIELIKMRLRAAEADHRARTGTGEGNG